MFTKTYTPKTNGKAERYNRAFVVALRAYFSDNQTDWDLYAPVVTFAYNKQVHSTTEMRPFDVVLSRDVPSLTIEPSPLDNALEPKLVRQR